MSAPAFGGKRRAVKHKAIEIHELVWDGITIQITYELHWSTVLDDVACILFRTIVPGGAALPISDEGTYVHYTSRAVIRDAGGITHFVREFLDDAAAIVDWERHKLKLAQLSLF